MLKAITSDIEIDTDQTREVWSNGEVGDKAVSLHTDGIYVWAETNGDPVARQDELAALLREQGFTEDRVGRIIEGDLSDLS